MSSYRSSASSVHTRSTFPPHGMHAPRPSRNTEASISLKRYTGTNSLHARYLHDSEALEPSVPTHPPHLVVALAAGVEVLHPQPQRHTPHKLFQGTHFLPSLDTYTIEHSLPRPSNPILRDEKFGVVFPAPAPAPAPPPTRALPPTPTTAPHVPALPSRPILARPKLLRSHFSSWSSTNSSVSVRLCHSEEPLSSISSSASLDSLTPPPTPPRPTGLARVIDQGGFVAISSLVKPPSRASSVASSVTKTIRRIGSRVSLCG
jgi:hypothetical protein